MTKTQGDLEAQERARWAQRVHAARLRLGWSKEEAARFAGISSITWSRVEDAEPVRDGKLGAVLDAVGLGPVIPGEHVVDLSGLTPKQREAVVSVVRAMLDPGSEVPDETGATTETKTGSVELQGSAKSRQRRSKAG